MRTVPLEQLDLHRLAEMSAPDRASLTAYLRDGDDVDWLEKAVDHSLGLLADDGSSDEAEELRRNADPLLEALRRADHHGPERVYQHVCRSVLSGH